jgi:Tol biopolymer transport system component
VVSGLSIVDVRSGRVRALPTREHAFQPAWSPHGSRIAFWGVRGTSGQRDIWTTSADGSEAGRDAVPVTNDPALDWSPTWAPDGKYLYFSSTRGGILNLWRVAIDEQSGRMVGDPEPITAPSAWSGFLSFSRDGTRLAFASLDYRSTLFRVPFDAARGVTGPAAPIVKGTRPIRDHELSPDGEWVAFTSAGPQEDLFTARVDGTQYRRLTDDAFRDRGPAWAPDGSRIAFYSDRSGTYDLWTIRPDGSALAPLTQGTGMPGFPNWSPDGKTIAFGFQTWHIISASGHPAAAYAPQPAISQTEQFQPTSWSTSGDRLAGLIVGGSTSTVATYDIASKKFSRVPGELARSGPWILPIWLGDGRHLILRRSDGVALIDASTGAGRLLIPVGGSIIGRSVGVSRDNRWITYTETATEGDIWIASLKN